VATSYLTLESDVCILNEEKSSHRELKLVLEGIKNNLANTMVCSFPKGNT
jgi:hypothetical protein